MIAFTVNDMTCGHCVSTVTRAIAAADAGARVTIDLPSHRVSIEQGAASAAVFAEAITEAGYTPVAVPVL